MDAVRTPGILKRHPEVRWIAAVVIAVTVVALSANYVAESFREQAGLSATGPEQLVAEVRAQHVGGYNGTILAKVDLDLPPAATLAFAREMPFGGSLLNGSHSIRYWYGGKTRQRVAVVEQNAEQDMFRNGARVVLWDTGTRTFSHADVPSDSTQLPIAVGPMVLTPPELADDILGIASDQSVTTLRSGDEVAGRPTYELIVQPTSDQSLIGSVRIQVDGRQAVPLGVQVYARGDDRAAIDLAFTSIEYGAAEDRNFSFVPPSGAQRRLAAQLDPALARTTGSGWLQVLSWRADRTAGDLVHRVFAHRMHKVDGRWGKGRLYTSPVLSVLVTSKGEVLMGAVRPPVLYAAVAR